MEILPLLIASFISATRAISTSGSVLNCVCASPRTGSMAALRATVVPSGATVRVCSALLALLIAVVIFVGMVIYGEVAYGRIVQMNTISNLLINNAHLIILAVGLTFVILTGGIDLSVGSMLALVGSFSVVVFNATDSVFLTLLFALVAGVAGLGYGLVFHLSGRLWPALLLHAAVNLTHLLLLSYPLRSA